MADRQTAADTLASLTAHESESTAAIAATASLPASVALTDCEKKTQGALPPIGSFALVYYENERDPGFHSLPARISSQDVAAGTIDYEQLFSDGDSGTLDASEEGDDPATKQWKRISFADEKQMVKFFVSKVKESARRQNQVAGGHKLVALARAPTQRGGWMKLEANVARPTAAHGPLQPKLSKFAYDGHVIEQPSWKKIDAHLDSLNLTPAASPVVASVAATRSSAEGAPVETSGPVASARPEALSSSSSDAARASPSSPKRSRDDTTTEDEAPTDDEGEFDVTDETVGTAEADYKAAQDKVDEMHRAWPLTPPKTREELATLESLKETLFDLMVARDTEKIKLDSKVKAREVQKQREETVRQVREARASYAEAKTLDSKTTETLEGTRAAKRLAIDKRNRLRAEWEEAEADVNRAIDTEHHAMEAKKISSGAVAAHAQAVDDLEARLREHEAEERSVKRELFQA